MPRIKKPDRFGRIIPRVVCVELLAVLVLVWMFLVAFQPLAKESWGYWLYWLHDYVFLPLKGYTYTLNYPFSLIWWGFLVTVLGVWMVFFMLDRSITQRPQIGFLRFAVRHASLHGLLLLMPRLLSHNWLEPRLLKNIVEYERTLALDRLITSQPNKTECAQVVHLTKLLNKLLVLPKTTTTAHRMQAAVYWHEAFFHIRFYSNEQAEWWPGLATNLAESLEEAIDPVLNIENKNSDQIRDILTRSTPFYPDVIGIELLYLACLKNTESVTTQPSLRTSKIAFRIKRFDPLKSLLGQKWLQTFARITRPKQLDELADSILGSELAAWPTQTRNLWIYSSLPQTIEARRLLLDKIRHRFEMIALPNRSNPDNTDFGDINGLIPDIDSDSLRAIGQLSLSLALELATRPGMPPNIALDYLDSFEAFTFVLEFVASDPDNLTSDFVKRLTALVGDLPRAKDYELCAKLAETHLNDYRAVWEDSFFVKDGPIKTDDFDLARTRIDSLYMAAGPSSEGNAAE